VLSTGGFDVEEAADGLKALQHLDNRPPDLVVLDLRMPMLSGAEVRQELAANVLTRQIPVVVVTGSPEALGDVPVDCVLTKPVMPEDLLAAVRRCLASYLTPAPGSSGA
jgi:CheY-like chemotaxis protein